jgi:hypothetical protein
MFITKKHLSRRTFLRGAGVTVGLPLLDAMIPAWTALAQTAASPKPHMGFLYLPHGAIMEQWTPMAEGANFELTPILKPFAPFQKQLTIISGLENKGAIAPPVHALSPGTWLSGVLPREGQEPHGGVTIDQIAAEHLGQDTPLPSLEVATEDFTGYVGACSPGFSCAYLNTISWSSPTTPLPMEINPRVVFERLFGQAGTASSRVARTRQERSILDSISQEANDLRRVLGARDRGRVSEYLDNIREIERRIQRTEAHNTSQVTSVGAPVGVPDSFEEHVGLMYDLVAAAFQADMTRVFSFMLSRELSQRTYANLGVTEQHHSVSHHGNDPDKIAKNVKINTYHMQLFARFLEKLRSTEDGDGTLLDHAVIFHGSGMGNPNGHLTDPLPVIGLGGGLGKGYRHIELPARTPVGDLWLSVANKFGDKLTEFGDGNKAIELFA